MNTMDRRDALKTLLCGPAAMTASGLLHAQDRYQAASWAGIVVPKATPPAAVDTLCKAFDKALKAPDVARRLAGQLYEPVGAGPAAFARLLAAEEDKWSKRVKKLGVRLD